GVDLRIQEIHRAAEGQGEAIESVVRVVAFLLRLRDDVGRLLFLHRRRVRQTALPAAPIELPHFSVGADEFVAVVVETAPRVIDVPAETELGVEAFAAAAQEDGLLVDLRPVERGVDREGEVAANLLRLRTPLGLDADGIDLELPVTSTGAGADAEAIPAVPL